MKRWISALLCAALSLGLAGCAAPAPEQPDGKLRVVATVFPGYDFARAVCGDLGEVTMLLPPGAESHSYEPTPADILAVQNCDLFIYIGGESDAWVDTLLESAQPQGAQLRMLECVDTLEEETVEGMTAAGHDHDHGHDDHDDHGGLGKVVDVDEHVWTSPRNAIRITQAIAEEAERLDPAHAESYASQAADYEAQLTQLDADFTAFFAGLDHPTLIFGDRFPLRYFAEAYGLTYYAAFPGCSAQTEPSAATIAFLTDKVKQEKIPTIYYIEFSNHLVADSIAEITGAGTAEFQTCHNVSRQQMEEGATYVSLMRQNLDMLRRTMPQN